MLEYRIDPFTVPGKKLDDVISAITSVTGSVPRITPLVGDKQLAANSNAVPSAAKLQKAGNGHAKPQRFEGTKADHLQHDLAKQGHTAITAQQIMSWLKLHDYAIGNYNSISTKGRKEGWLVPTDTKGEFRVKKSKLKS